MQWLMLQQEPPEDYVIPTGVQYTVRQIILWAAEEKGISLELSGDGVEEPAKIISIRGDRVPS